MTSMINLLPFVLDAVVSSQIFFTTHDLKRAYQVDKESNLFLMQKNSLGFLT